MKTSPRSLTSVLLSLSVLGVASLLLPTACNSSPELGDGEGKPCDADVDCREGQYCSPTRVCEASCPECGEPCDSTVDCPSGQFCSSGKTCQQQCDPDGEAEECVGILVCSENGQCVGEDTIELGGGGATGDGDGDGDGGCIEVEVDFSPQIPNVVLLIDQSASMNAPSSWRSQVDAAVDAGSYEFWDCPDTGPNTSDRDNDNDQSSDGKWRWNVVRNILLNPDTGLVKPLEDRVRFGLALYSSELGDIGGTCPMLTEVALNFDNHAAMLSSFECSDVVRDTPTRESLTAVAEQLAAEDVEGPKVIVLATDGEPDTCACANWDSNDGRPQSCVAGNSDNDVEYPGDELHAAGTYANFLYEQILVALEAKRIQEEFGITVEVINVGAPGLKAHLDKVANFGGAVSGAAIDGTSPGALADAFQTIIDGVRSCAIDLDGEIASGEENSGTVLLDRDSSVAVDFEELELDDPNGWRVNSSSQIELLGDACATIKTGDHALDISFPCGTFVVNPR